MENIRSHIIYLRNLWREYWLSSGNVDFPSQNAETSIYYRNACHSCTSASHTWNPIHIQASVIQYYVRRSDIMAVYIAICDDNAADRKQFERLLEREKTARVSKGEVLYIDSFGSKEALMHTPIKYDLFLIDITLEKENGMDIAKALRKEGISAPIVLFTSTIDYKSFGNPPDNITYFDKPVLKGQITHLVDDALIRSKNKVPLIEVRCQNDTHFIKCNDIIYVKDLGTQLEIVLTGGKYLKVYDTILHYYDSLEPYNCFLQAKKDLINMHHIVRAEGNSFVLTNNDKVPFSIFQRKELIKSFAEFQNNK